MGSGASMTEGAVTQEPSNPVEQSPGLRTPPSAATPALDYGRGENVSRPARGAWSSFVGGFWDRVHGVAEFLGMLSAMCAFRRIGLGIALACILGGAGHLAATFTGMYPSEVHGWGWMTFGGFILGLCWPRND